jgi:hypothetical protein
VDTSEALHL